MPTKLDLRRLKTANAAPLELSNDLGILKAQIERLGDALAAMQSLDDLGSPEANQAAMEQHDDILRRLLKAEEKFKAMDNPYDTSRS